MLMELYSRNMISGFGSFHTIYAQTHSAKPSQIPKINIDSCFRCGRCITLPNRTISDVLRNSSISSRKSVFTDFYPPEDAQSMANRRQFHVKQRKKRPDTIFIDEARSCNSIIFRYAEITPLFRFVFDNKTSADD